MNRLRVVFSDIICESARLVTTWQILFVCVCVCVCARARASQLVVFPKLSVFATVVHNLSYASVCLGLTTLQRLLHRRYERCPSPATSQAPWPRQNAGTRSESYHGALTASWRRLSQLSTFLPSRRLRLVHTRYEFLSLSLCSAMAVICVALIALVRLFSVFTYCNAFYASLWFSK